MSLLWQCLFIGLADRQINEIAVQDQQDAFAFLVKTTPHTHEIRFHVYLDRMAEDYDDPEMMEKYWRAMEGGLPKSKVLLTHAEMLASGFRMIGTALADKKFRRDFQSRAMTR